MTGVFEATATAIGSGLVVGSFGIGLGSLIGTRSRKRSERWSFTGGYVGGLVALATLAIDTLVKRFV